jgi:hypothetical protein
LWSVVGQLLLSTCEVFQCLYNIMWYSILL